MFLKNIKIFGAAIAVLVIFAIYLNATGTYLDNFTNFKRYEKFRLPSFRRQREKMILLWNSPHRIEASSFGVGHEAFVTNGCAVNNCRIVIDPSEYPMEIYDAIVFNMHELYMSYLPNFNRSPLQRFIFFTQESPQTMSLKLSDYEGYFNWTMSYKLDSDIHLLYGRVEPRVKTESNAGAKRKAKLYHRFGGKTRLVAWMASHCTTNSLREDYVAELGRYIPVDIYGACGNGNFFCPRNESHWLSEKFCYDRIEYNYKFYLSFENSICNDYVTEKFFLLMERRVVPIVFGGADYERLAPPHSFIDARKFEPSSLANYLLHLNANPLLYEEYFRWKDNYTVQAGVEQMARHGFCDLCSKLHQDLPAKVYNNLADHWSSETQCLIVKKWNATSNHMKRSSYN